MKKTILYIGGFELPDKNAAAQRVIANAKIFRELGYGVCFIGVSKDKVEKDIRKTESEFEGFKYYQINYPVTGKEWISYLISISYIKKISREFSIVIAYNYPGVALYRLLQCCRKNKVLLLADCTEWYQPKGGILYRYLKKIDTSLRMKIVQLRLDGIIVISKYLYNYYISRMAHTIYLPPLVDLSMEKWKREGEVQTDAADVKTIVYAGSPGTGQKDRLDVIIKTLSEIIEETTITLKFIVVGITREQYFHSFPKETFPDTLRNFVFFKGRLSHVATLDYIKQSDYVLFLRDNNLVNNAGFPTKFVEALSAGTPILTNLTSNLDIYLKEGYNGFVLDYSSPRNLYQSLKKALLTDREKIDQMKQNCRKDRFFDYKNYIKEADVFLNDLMK